MLSNAKWYLWLCKTWDFYMYLFLSQKLLRGSLARTRSNIRGGKGSEIVTGLCKQFQGLALLRELSIISLFTSNGHFGFKRLSIYWYQQRKIFNQEHCCYRLLKSSGHKWCADFKLSEVVSPKNFLPPKTLGATLAHQFLYWGNRNNRNTLA